MTQTLKHPHRTTPITGVPPRLHRGLLLLMSAATGLSVAGNYFAQPLLEVIGRDLGLSTTMAALVVTAAQGGYALGLILLVPLGDLVERRRLAVLLFAGTAVFQLVSALAPSAPVLLAGTAATALTSVAAQVVVPYAATLAAPAERGRVVGTVMTGLLLGALLARTASGTLSELAGWRTIYWLNAVLVAVVAVLLWRFLPRLHTRVGLSYPALLWSTLGMFRHEPLLRWRAGIGALSFAAFSVLWTSITFLLTGPSYGWREAAVGMFSLVGVVTALTTPIAGRFADRGWVQRVSGIGTAVLALSWPAIHAGAFAPGWLVAGVVLFNVAQGAVLNAGQNVIYALSPENRNRLNSAFMTACFLGGAAGSLLASVAWSGGGWSGVSLLGGALSATTFALWALERVRAKRSALPVS
ncbi:sugar transporter [Sphaerisporangium melleum]|uniref:Sugar transporter n=1 Tax=Sphaerisporangium melleum TaxID=321316 RepID=A0A917VKT2_9ACTN|nr:MFS transporter [Sphaerisporangium melleum]GGK95165.1 sugar transporter [Sphaerisporangium melleum]GII73325.1 sugar transporter [Sphaerisporangium melleum]